MSDEKVGGVPLTVIVKGGTSTSAWDRQKAEQYRQSDELRAHQDRQRQAVAEAQGQPNVRAALLSRQLLSPTNPKVVIVYKGRDSALDRDCLCELVLSPRADADEDEMILVLVCPKCLERTGRMDDSQVIIRSSHKRMHLDTSRAGAWINPLDGQVHHLAGEITIDEKCKCDAVGCTWRFAIEASKLKEC